MKQKTDWICRRKKGLSGSLVRVYGLLRELEALAKQVHGWFPVFKLVLSLSDGLAFLLQRVQLLLFTIVESSLGSAFGLAWYNSGVY